MIAVLLVCCVCAELGCDDSGTGSLPPRDRNRAETAFGAPGCDHGGIIAAVVSGPAVVRLVRDWSSCKLS